MIHDLSPDINIGGRAAARAKACGIHGSALRGYQVGQRPAAEAARATAGREAAVRVSAGRARIRGKMADLGIIAAGFLR